jgi:outer membrane biosynthesis protein TonB
VSFVTDGDTEDLGTGYLRRPISVAQLLEREGYRPTVRSRTARRALSGVAAGAVLTLGAVVGSLFLNHGQRTTGDLASAGLAQSGGDIVLAESNTPPGSAPSATHTAAATTPAPTASRTPTAHHQATQRTVTTPTHQNRTEATHQNPTTQHQQPPALAATTTPQQQSTPTTQSDPTATTQLTPNTTTGTSTPATPTTTQPTTTTQPPTTQPTSTTPDGLIGGVGQVLGSVTQPVFDWFN